MRLLARDTLKPLKQGIVNELGPELVNQLVVVNRLHLAVLANLARHAPGVDILLMWFWDSWLGGFCFCHGDWEILWWGREMSQRSANNEEVTRVRVVCKQSCSHPWTFLICLNRLIKYPEFWSVNYSIFDLRTWRFSLSKTQSAMYEAECGRPIA